MDPNGDELQWNMSDPINDDDNDVFIDEDVDDHDVVDDVLIDFYVDDDDANDYDDLMYDVLDIEIHFSSTTFERP